MGGHILIVEEILKSYRIRNCKIKNKQLEIETLKSIGDNEKINKIEYEIKNLEIENKKIDNILEVQLGDKELELKVIKYRYLEGGSKRKIANKIDRTIRQVDRLINNALLKIKL